LLFCCCILLPLLQHLPVELCHVPRLFLLNKHLAVRFFWIDEHASPRERRRCGVERSGLRRVRLRPRRGAERYKPGGRSLLLLRWGSKARRCPLRREALRLQLHDLLLKQLVLQLHRIVEPSGRRHRHRGAVLWLRNASRSRAPVAPPPN
jgi:hypothetical protein